MIGAFDLLLFVFANVWLTWTSSERFNATPQLRFMMAGCHWQRGQLSPPEGM